MDFELPAGLIELRERVAAFVRDEVIPRERDERPDVDALRDKARSAGVFVPHLKLDTIGMCVVFEQAGRSLLGPSALHCAAPDEGNMHLLSLFATPEQRTRFLDPLIEGKISSCFAMTEPAPGAGSDPSMMLTRAERVDGGWEITGRKWFATGASSAAFAVVMAKTGDDATMFLVPATTPGFRLIRSIPTMGTHDITHDEIELNRVRVGDDAVLGEVNDGFKLAQVRLGPARLTHCMRWLGAAQRALEIATARAKEREAFGKPLAGHEAVQWMIADSEIELHASRLMTMHAAWKHDCGEDMRHEASMCKVFVSEAVNRVIDRAIQICGALGISADTPLEQFYREARAFRIYDGPSEVHRFVIARRVLKR